MGTLSRVWITGASGFLGRELLTLAPHADATRVEIRDAAAVRRHIRALAPTTVLHTAACPRGPDTWSTNVDGAEIVADAAVEAGAAFVHVSTDLVFDGRKGEPYVEEDQLAPLGDYGRSKAEAENRVARAHPTAVIVRTSLIYGGPGRQPSAHELAALDPGHAFYTDEVRSPIQVTDLASALLELAALNVAGTFHLAGPDGASRYEFASLIAGRSVRAAVAPPSRPRDVRLDSSRTLALIRTRPRGVRKLLR